jgi:hypothetical protein
MHAPHRALTLTCLGFLSCVALAGCPTPTNPGEAGRTSSGSKTQDDDWKALSQTIPVTHQWSVKAESSPFAVAMMGTTPPGYADMLMGVLPTALFKATTGCADAGEPVASLVLRAEVTKGSPTRWMSAPKAAYADCVRAALRDLKLPPSPVDAMRVEVTLHQTAPAGP